MKTTLEIKTNNDMLWLLDSSCIGEYINEGGEYTTIAGVISDYAVVRPAAIAELMKIADKQGIQLENVVKDWDNFQGGIFAVACAIIEKEANIN